VHAVVDAVPFCHVGVALGAHDDVVVLPFLHARDGATVYLHGSRSNRLLRALVAAPRVCATFTSSVAYRSAVVFGPAHLVEDARGRAVALDLLVEAVLPGRSAEMRQPNETELALTTVVALTIEEASAKVSVGPTDDEPDDVASPVWAGDVPARLVYGEPVGALDGAMADGSVPLPASVRALLGR